MFKSVLLAILLAIGGLQPAPSPPDSKMTTPERDELLELLQQSERQFMSAVEGLTDAQWSFKPGPDRWSVGEVAEHIVLAEASLFDGATKMLRGEVDPKWNETLAKTELLKRALPNRSRKVDAPVAIQPKHEMTRAQIMARFKEQRARSITFARNTDAPLKSYTSANPFFGPLNAHQWLIYIPLHHIRHNQQIDEVKAAPQFPK